MKPINQILIALIICACACGNRSTKVAESMSSNDSTLIEDLVDNSEQEYDSLCISCLLHIALFQDIEKHKYIYGIQYDLSGEKEMYSRDEAINKKVEEGIEMSSQRKQNIYETCKDCPDLLEIIKEWREQYDFKTWHTKIETEKREKEERETKNINQVIANFNKYKNEELLFEGIEHYGFIEMGFSDTLLIFNFEKGTVKKIKRTPNKSLENLFGLYTTYYITEQIITGDFNGNGKRDTLMIENFENLFQKYGYYDIFDDKVDIYFVFSDKTIPKLEVWGECLGCMIENLGDLDGDGGDEIGFFPCTTGHIDDYYVYTLKNNKWKLMIDMLTLTRDMLPAGIIPVEKDPEQKGNILIHLPAAGSSNCCTPYVVEKSWKYKGKPFDNSKWHLK